MLISNFQKLVIFTLVVVSLSLFSFQSQAAEVLPNPPEIISRQEWNADESWRTNEAYWPQTEDGRPDPQAKVIILHHTASANLQSDPDQSGQYAGMVRDIYRFHTKSKVWYDETGQKHSGVGDLCYNYLVDINGNIYQGRDGGNGIVGAHAAGFNTGSIGLALIGTYGGTIQGKYLDHQITLRLKNSLINLIAWLAATNDIDLNAKVRLCNYEGNNCQYVYPLLGHRDVGSTQCPGNSLYALIPEIRQEAAKLALKYKDYLYQNNGENPVYLIKKGVKKPFENLASFQQKIGAYTKLNLVAKNLTDLFPLEALIKYRDGNLVKADNAAQVYLLKDQQLRPIVSANLFQAYQFDWSKIAMLNPVELAAFKPGPKLLYPDGVLLKGSAAAVYLINKEQRRHIVSPLVFDKRGYQWSEILTVADAELNEHTVGPDFLLPSGTLAKEKDKPLVYYLEDNSRRPIPSADIFTQRQFQWQDILTLDKTELALYQEAKPLLLPNDCLIKLADKPEVYVVKQERRYWLVSWNLLKDLGLKAENIIKVAAADLANYTLGSTITNVADWQKIASVTQAATVVPVDSLARQIGAAASDDGSSGLAYTPPAASPADQGNNQPVTNSSAGTTTATTTPSTSDIQSATTTAASLNLGPLIRIAITSLKPDENVVMTVLSDYEVYKNDQLTATKKAQELFILTPADLARNACGCETPDVYQFIPVVGTGSRVVAGDRPDLSLQNSHPEILEIVSYESRPVWNPSLNDNQFRGKIELRYSAVSKKWWLINELPLEQYVWGVAEITNEQAPEYLKAMTIAARSYAYYHLSRGGKRAGEPYILNTTANDQVYRGYGFEKRADKVKEAALATAGQILFFNSQPAVTPYSSDSGGVSKDACQLWGSTFCDPVYAYLRGGVKDPAATQHTQSAIAASHGVGLSAVGARQMASEGLTYDQILGKYYPGTIISDSTAL